MKSNTPESHQKKAAFWLRISLIGWIIACIAALVSLVACVAPPVRDQRSPFERCMTSLTSDTWASSARRDAAEWCRANDNGGIR